MKRYVVIGGQDNEFFYGDFDSVHEAKIRATSHGWYEPKIYSCRQIEIVNKFYRPKYDATPLYVRDNKTKKWVSGGCYV